MFYSSQGALATLDPIDLDKPGLFTKVAGASVSTAYHVGFAYFMLGRYTDATRHFNQSLVFVNRHKVAATRPYSLDLLLKKQEQMYALCAMSVILGGNGSSNGGVSVSCAARLLEEGVAGSLREKHGDDMSRMAQGVVSAFDEAFSFACPKFVTPGGPPSTVSDTAGDDASAAGGGANYNEEAYRRELKKFIAEVSSREKLPTLRSLLKLYTSISVPKLADLMEISVEELREQLEVLRKKSHVTQWSSGASALSGELVSVTDLDVTVAGDAIKTSDVAAPRGNGEYFLRHIAKQNTLMEDLAPAKALVYKGKLPGQTA